MIESNAMIYGGFSFDKEVRLMSELVLSKVHVGRRERKSLGESIAAFMNYTMNWYSDLARKSGYRFPFSL